MVPWPSDQAEVCKTFYSGLNPLGTSKIAGFSGFFYVIYTWFGLDF